MDTPWPRPSHPTPRAVRPLGVHCSSRLRTAVTITGNILTGQQYAPLRPVLATATSKADKLIGSLQREEG
jgi:hypothetical protein